MSRIASTLAWMLAAWVSGAAWGSDIVGIVLAAWAVLGCHRSQKRGWPDLLLAAGVYLIAFLQAPEGMAVPARWSAFAVALVAVGSWRRVTLDALDFALLALAFVGAGSGRIGQMYPIAMFVAFALFFFSRGVSKRFFFRKLGTTAAIVASGALLTAGLIWLLPVIQRALIGSFSDLPTPVAAGFSKSIQLGAFREVLDSNKALLRLRGEHADYLRGRVYLRYLGGQWLGTDALDTFDRYEAEGGATEVVALAPLPAFFMPAGVHPRAVEGQSARTDRTGTFAPPPGHEAGWVRFDATVHAMDPPEALALSVPPRLGPRLLQLAGRWTQGASTAIDRMNTMQQKLQSFDYTLESPPKVREPLIHFLFERRAGHCEYFASSLTLLARSLGIPARVATGFRVTEHNALGDFYTVRGANAHAWTEAWVDGRWQRFDGTPSGVEMHMASSSTGLNELLDAIKDLWARNGLPEIPRWLSLLLIAAGFVFLMLRRLRPKAAQLNLPMPDELAAFLGSLEKGGHKRRPGEPLENLARRLPAHLARPLWRYSAWCYGDQGHYEEVRKELRAGTQAGKELKPGRSELR